MKTDEEILGLYKTRSDRYGPLRQRARDVRNAYHGDFVLPVPELDKMDRPTVANLICLGVDQMSRRTVSTMPMPMFLADGDTKAARDRASDRRSVVLDWWRQEHLRMKMMRLSRHFSAYAAAYLTLTPGDYDRACWRVRDPLDALPADTDMDSCEMTDCIFDSVRSMGWTRANYPMINLPSRDLVRDETIVSLIEYIDAEERVYLASWNSVEGISTGPSINTVRLGRAPIEIGRCPVAVAFRPGLARPAGQMDGVIGPYWAQAMLQALEVVAVKKSVFPDTWMVGGNAETPKIIVEADGLRGDTGIVTNAKPWVNTAQPGYTGFQAIDRYERDMRVTGGIPAEFGGESASNVRTGRRGDSILSATIDFAIQEAQEVFAPFLHAANMIAIDYDRTWYPRRKTFYVRRGDREEARTYRPKELWANDRHEVAYAFAGTDAAGLIIELGQSLGTELMSHRTAMLIHPLIDDPEDEHDRIQVEKLESALLQGLLAQASQGALPPSDLARIMALVQGDVDLAKAVEQAHTEAQQRQAQQVPATDPAAQPGIAQPGAGAEAQPSIPPPSPGTRNLASLASALGRPFAEAPA